MKNHRILVVEDEVIVAMDIEDRLTALGYQVAGRAASGEQAMELTTAQHPDLILMDIRLDGDRDGIATAREIRQRFHIPVIFLTAYSEDETLERAKLAEPFGYLLKPFEDQELKSTIEIAIYKHAAEEEIRRLNRLFEVLSQVNQAVVYSRSREEVLTEVCRLLVERGKVDLAWIGWLDPATSHIRPVAQHGCCPEILVQADFYADGRQEGQGIPGKAIREGKPFICLACPSEACLYPAEKQPHHFGFRACGSFPLRLGGEVCAVLNICVAEPKFFGDRETELLQEVALDLSLALDKQESELRRGQAEKAFQASEEKFRLAMEAAEEGIWDWDIPTGEMYLSPGFMRVMGYEPGETEINSQVWQEHVHPEDWPKVFKALQDHFGGRTPSYECEYRVRSKTGDYRWVRARGRVVSRQSDGVPLRIVGAVSDITDRRLIEDKIKESEARYRRIVETALEGIWAMDEEFRTTFVNQNMAELLGYRQEEMLGKLISDFMFPADLEQHEQKKIRRRQGEDDKYEQRFKRQDGSELWTLVSATALMDEAGGFQGSFGMFTDITERRRMEEALKESEGRVRAKLDSILSPAGDIGRLELEDIIDTQAIQALMDNFSRLIRLPMAIVDLNGKVLIGIGWQDICTQFHRRHPITRQRCLESDLELSRGVPIGTFKLYKCKNNLWSIATPIMVAGKHLGNLFMGQFLFNDEVPDVEFFRDQARQYGFEETGYLAALARLPRFSRQTIDQAMGFFSKLAHMISMLCHNNIKLARSIAEQERLVEELRASEDKIRGDEQFLNDIFSGIKDGLCILDLSRNVIRVNPAILNLAHIPPIEGRKCYQVFHDRNEPCEDCPVEHTLQTGEANQGVMEINSGEDNTSFIEINCYPFINRDGRLAGAIEFVRDITQVKKAEETLKEMERQLLQAQKMEAIGTLAGGIAHDFNNILWAIMGYAEMASYNLLNTEMARQYLDQVLKASQRAKNLVGQILAFSRRLESKKKPLFLKNIAQEAVNLLRASLPATIEIRPRLQSESPILADPTQMSQVIMNLATNAFHAMEKTGGLLTLILEDALVEQPLAAVHGELAPGAYVRLQLQDTGTGIDPAIISRIFEPYFTTKEVGKGTGLGLATVLGIVKNHGGEIVLESRPNHGTVFSVYYPIIGQQPDKPLQAKPTLPKSAGRILFIDDEPSLAELCKAALTRLGYDVRAFTNSREALATFEASPQDIDLVITDLTMPHLTGIDLTKRFQAIRPDLPIIMCTGYTELLKPEEVKSLGIHEVLSKPLGLTQLAETVKQALQPDST